MGLNKYFENIRRAPKCMLGKDFPKGDTIHPGFEDELGIQQVRAGERNSICKGRRSEIEWHVCERDSMRFKCRTCEE